ncbi:ribonuclease Z [Alkalihalobacillus sp. LMS39]|uniref:ribonuclease Z n=1 Tax=Alkalihalobacillus sp. LMS39 TaxID=2924032 RepID=UPI001FB342B4|nr:ribonuclease Z [Alkalihalobacillus sp. LMS39]UOE92285.1 ribonuclease Z [Alkalihalobacillus sp. LMS39]
MEIHFFGTGAGIPSKERNVSGLALRFLQQNGKVWLFDCGEATQHQLLYSRLSLSKVEKIFISHLHGDHIYGLPGLLGSRSFQGATSPLKVFGPKGIKVFIETTLAVSKTYLKYPLYIDEIEKGILWDDKEGKMEVFSLEHAIESFGFRFSEKAKRGKLQIDKLMEKGIQPGPIYEQLKQGQTITLENGEKIDGTQFVGPSQRGRVIAVAGDTKICDSSYQLASDADLLIHEATFRSGEEETAAQFGHSTVKQATELALDCNVKQLLLTHISSRYHNETKEIEQEAQAIFPSCFVANDFDVFSFDEKNKKLSKQTN